MTNYSKLTIILGEISSLMCMGLLLVHSASESTLTFVQAGAIFIFGVSAVALQAVQQSMKWYE